MLKLQSFETKSSIAQNAIAGSPASISENEVKQLKTLLLGQHPNVQPSTSTISGE